MSGKLDIMHAIREGLDGVEFPHNDTFKGWTGLVLRKLCDIGQRQFRCYVCTNKTHAPEAECGEWLYDMTWLEYTGHNIGQAESAGWLVDAHLVAECEWASNGPNRVGQVEDDFSKLLLAYAGVRLMVFYDWKSTWDREDINNAEDMADNLAEQVRRFNGLRAEDAYLLAVLGWDDSGQVLGFKYFTLGLNGALPFPGR